MCGIFGIVSRNGFNEELLKSARDTMRHRGPDDSGTWINRDGTVGLAHRRLSIIDLSEAGRQPMSDSEGTSWITYNGEIYNFQEIRRELEGKGYHFKSRTDTEVIVNAYKEWGTDCLEKLNGMFAFGIYDEKEGILFLARDRGGEKPLYYANYDGRFAFSSELKALLKDENLPREIELRALNFYLTFGYIPGELCIYKAVKKLQSAHALTYRIDTGQHRIWKYWEPPPLTEKPQCEDELLEELEALLEDAVRLRLISDVPLGAFLSGGIDSSLVVAMMSKVSSSPVKTFSIGFEESMYNELPYARVVAKHFNTDHHEVILKPDALSVLPELVRQFDEPFADSSMIPTYYISKATRDYVTVALSGDGGDELFGGYSCYLETLGNHYAARLIPLAIRKSISRAAEYMPERCAGKRQLLRLKFDSLDAFIDRSSYCFFNERHRRLVLNEESVAQLNDAFLEPETSRRRHLLNRKGDLINRLTYADFKVYLPDDIFVKVDRSSMLVSLEVRAPMLDYRIVEFSFKNIPGNLKVRATCTKYLLKKLASRILPREFDTTRRKMGFAIPLCEWFRGPSYSSVRQILMDRQSRLCRRDYIDKLLSEHVAGIDHSGRLFALLVLSLWEKEYLR